MLHDKLMLGLKEKYGNYFGVLVVIGIFYTMILNGLYKNYYYKADLKEVSLENIVYAGDEHQYVRLHYDSVLYDHTVSDVDYDEKNYTGEFWVPLKISEKNAPTQTLVWFYREDIVGNRYERELRKDFKEVLGTRGDAAFVLYDPVIPASELSEVRSVTSELGFKDLVILEKVDLDFNDEESKFWIDLFSIVFNIGFLMVITLAIINRNK